MTWSHLSLPHPAPFLPPSQCDPIRSSQGDSFLSRAWLWPPLSPLSPAGHHCQIYLATHAFLKLGHTTLLNVLVFSGRRPDQAQTPALTGRKGPPRESLLISQCKHFGPSGPPFIQ